MRLGVEISHPALTCADEAIEWRIFFGAAITDSDLKKKKPPSGISSLDGFAAGGNRPDVDMSGAA
jgi:hypothetical protein